MSEHVLKERKDIPEAYQWDIASMYDSDEIWEKDLRRQIRALPNFSAFRDISVIPLLFSRMR